MISIKNSKRIATPYFKATDIVQKIQDVRSPCFVIQDPKSLHVGIAPAKHKLNDMALAAGQLDPYLMLGYLPPLFPEWLGDRSFNEYHRLRYSYIAGEMAQGISSPELVITMAKAGMMGVYGAGGLGMDKIEKDILQIKSKLAGDFPWAVNLIHSPQEPYLEQQAVDLFLKHGVGTVSASAFMQLEPSIVRYCSKGLHRDQHGNIVRPNKLIAKVSRREVAKQFMLPAPQAMLKQLFNKGEITAEEMQLALQIPVARDITAEADSGGHTDNRPLNCLLPDLIKLRNEISDNQHNIRIGAAGGLGTPAALAGAYAMGAAYVVTGSINQSALESGQSAAVRKLLAQQDIADVAMAPAADMFELGVKLQVSKRGTLFAQRAQMLYDTYLKYKSLEAIPTDLRNTLEQKIFRYSLEQVWQQTQNFWLQRHPETVQQAQANAKLKMALVFRWYLGMSSHWARHGDKERQLDYQIWSGPAMGAFNNWVKGSFLESPRQRSAVQIALNLLEGAAIITRAQQLRNYGAPIPGEAFSYTPRVLRQE